MQYSRMKSSQIMNPNLAPEEFPTPRVASLPSCSCSPARRHREETCWQKRTKIPILCSKSLKMGVPKAKSAQKCRFCVKTAQNLGKIAHSDTKTSILCSKSQKMGVLEGKSAQKCRFCARDAGATPHRARVP